ncbi:MAG: type II toxin-antitoxin system RelE/ParE family toxin [Deltaproteobacteria bacterium]|nr:type II toxin-antitoxin system RelE/ParE family toxin [Deltaproteobacteria bacterium]
MKVRWSRLALRDLDAIFDYIARDDPSAALRWIGRLRAPNASPPSARGCSPRARRRRLCRDQPASPAAPAREHEGARTERRMPGSSCTPRG